MQIKLKLTRDEWDELDSFLDQAINDMTSEYFEEIHHGVDQSILARIHEKMIAHTERVFREELVGMNAADGRQRLAWKRKDE